MFLILKVLVSSAITFAATFQGNPNTEYKEYDFNGLEKARIVNGSGKITISEMPTNKVIIKIFKHNFSERCSIVMDKQEYSLLIVKIEHPLGETCSADIDLSLPKTIDLDITSGSGDVNIAGVGGALNFTLGSGTLVADGQYKKVEGKSGSGSVDIKGMTGGGSIDAGSGSVKLSFQQYPKGQLSVKAGSGNATLLFHKGSRVQTSLSSGTGDLSNEFGDDSNPDLTVSAKTGSGDLRVKSY